MSDPKNHAALTPLEVSHIVDASSTHSLIGASVLSSRVITEATAYFERSATALEKLLAVLDGKGDGSGPNSMKITATLDTASAKAVTDAVTGTIGPRIDDLHNSVASALAQLTDHAAKLASGATQLAQQQESLTEAHAKVRDLADTTARHEHAITAAILGEGGHIFRLEGAVADLARRVKRLEDHLRAGEASAVDSTAAEQAREMREANEALRERVAAMEASIRQLLEHGAQGGGQRSSRPR